MYVILNKQFRLASFGWLRVPTREILNQYWQKIIDDHLNNLIVGRLNGVIAGTLQLSYEAPNIESRKNISTNKKAFCCSMERGLWVS